MSAPLVQFEIAPCDDLDRLQAMWVELEQQAEPEFFLSWDWIGSWVREVPRMPHVLVGHVDHLVVLLGLVTPSIRQSLLLRSVAGVQLHMTGDPEQDVITIEYNGFLVASDWMGQLEASAIAFLLRGIEPNGRRYDELHLKNVPATLASAAASSGARIREVQRKPSWRIDLAAIRATDRDYLSTLSANTRQQIRRSMRLYAGRGPLSAVRARDAAEAHDYLAALKDLHQQYWTGRGEPGAFAFPFFERFQGRLIAAGVPHGTIELMRITAGSDVIGYIFNLVYRGHVYAYQTGIRYEDDGRLKPGLVSHSLCIQRHLDEGTAVYDFMAGEARYKASLGEPGPDMVYLLVQRATWPLRLENALHRLKQSVCR